MYSINSSSNLNIFKSHVSFKRKGHKVASNPQALQNDVFIRNIDSKNIKTNDIQDLAYKKRICDNKYFDNIKLENLESIVGPKELTSIVQKHSNDRTYYTPGERPKHSEGEQDSYDLKNVKNLEYGGNFHIHTTYSDGRLNVEELLDQASEYADLYAKKNNEPFVIGITDHNTVEGCKEAVELINNDPNKYRNLKVILGAEISVKEAKIGENEFTKPRKLHILTMGINPFDKDLNSFLDYLNEGKDTPMKPRSITLKELVSHLKTQKDITFSLAHPAYPNVKKIIYDWDDHYKTTKDIIKFFKKTTGKRALYVENYYNAYYGDIALDKRLHKMIEQATDEVKLYKAGGNDTHGENIFYAGVAKNKSEKTYKNI